jgi:hypothetical protein
MLFSARARAHTHTRLEQQTYHGIVEDEFHILCALLVCGDRADGPIIVPRLDPALRCVCACMCETYAWVATCIRAFTRVYVCVLPCTRVYVHMPRSIGLSTRS